MNKSIFLQANYKKEYLKEKRELSYDKKKKMKILIVTIDKGKGCFRR